MIGMFGSIVLVCSREAVDLTRVGQPAGMAFLADHDGTIPIGKVRRTSVKGGSVYASVDLVSTKRNAGYLEELRGGLRDGTSPGFLVHAAEITEIDDGDYLARITLWEPYEISSTPIPRNPSVGILKLDCSPSNKSASNEGAFGVDLSAGQRSKAPAVSHSKVPSTRTAEKRSDISAIGRACVSPVTLTAEGRRKKVLDQEAKLDERLIDLSKREIALTDAEAKPATGAPKPLAEALLSLAAHATNPSTPAPDLPGVEITSGRVNHLMGRIPAASAALTSSDVVGSEIQTVEVGDIQPQGRRARRLLGLCRQAAPKFGSQSFPVMTSAPASGMIVDGGAPLALTDAMFANPSPVARPHQGQARASYSLQSLIQGGAQFKEMVDSSLAVALADLMAGQLVAGTGVAPSLTGLLHTADTESVEYMATNRGAATMFRAASDLLDDQTYGPEGRLAWLIATSLYREARMTLREPGTGSYVIEDSQVLGETLALKNGDLGVNQAILFDASYVVFCIWDSMDVVIDAITSPGNVKITLTAWFDAVPLRPQSIIVVDQA